MVFAETVEFADPVLEICRFEAPLSEVEIGAVAGQADMALLELLWVPVAVVDGVELQPIYPVLESPLFVLEIFSAFLDAGFVVFGEFGLFRERVGVGVGIGEADG